MQILAAGPGVVEADSAATSSKRAPLTAANREKCNKRERSNRDRQGAKPFFVSLSFRAIG
jgi:hypothetical protein